MPPLSAAATRSAHRTHLSCWFSPASRSAISLLHVCHGAAACGISFNDYNGYSALLDFASPQMAHRLRTNRVLFYVADHRVRRRSRGWLAATAVARSARRGRTLLSLLARCAHLDAPGISELNWRSP